MIVENDIDKNILNNYWQTTYKVVQFNHQIKEGCDYHGRQKTIKYSDTSRYFG